MNDDVTSAAASRSGRGVVIALVVAVVAIVAYFAMGMPGMDHESGDPAMDEMDHSIAPTPAASPGTVSVSLSG